MREGVLQLGNGGTGAGFAAGASLAEGTQFVFNHSDRMDYAGSVSGQGTLVKRGTGRLVLSGSSAFTGGSILEEGTLTVAHGQALGDGALAMNDGTVLDYGQGIELGNDVSINGSGLLNVDEGKAAVQQGIISGGDMEKTGTGTLVLTGENTYRGATSVREGTLQVGDGAGPAPSSPWLIPPFPSPWLRERPWPSTAATTFITRERRQGKAGSSSGAPEHCW